ncbi:MAG: hypothetical protein K8J31_17460 [Anaerolineae bacterium]|nr:hypothetical protein [Anaerolineae bacterium]
MSLIDLILEQKLIVISVAAALIPLFVAIVLILRKRVRRMVKQRALTRAEKALQVAAIARSGAVSADQLDAMALEAHQQVVPEVSVQAPASPPSAATPANPVQAEAAPAQKPDQEQPAGAMQSLLSSVFGEGAVDHHRDVLLQKTETIDMAELAAFCSAVADQLHAYVEQ